MMKQDMEARLRARGCVVTPQRRAVLGFLDGNLDHPTAADVLAGVTQADPLASRATVYNTLALLEACGAVLVVKDGDELRYDPNTAAHHHTVCTDCGRIADIEGHRVSVTLDGAHTHSGNVTFRGRCPRCDPAP